MKDWIYVSENISFKNYDGNIHVRKINLETGNYSYMTLYDWEFLELFEKDESLCRQYTVIVAGRNK